MLNKFSNSCACVWPGRQAVPWAPIKRVSRLPLSIPVPVLVPVV